MRRLSPFLLVSLSASVANRNARRGVSSFPIGGQTTTTTTATTTTTTTRKTGQVDVCRSADRRPPKHGEHRVLCRSGSPVFFGASFLFLSRRFFHRLFRFFFFLGLLNFDERPQAAVLDASCAPRGPRLKVPDGSRTHTHTPKHRHTQAEEMTDHFHSPEP